MVVVETVPVQQLLLALFHRHDLVVLIVQIVVGMDVVLFQLQDAHRGLPAFRFSAANTSTLLFLVHVLDIGFGLVYSLKILRRRTGT